MPGPKPLCQLNDIEDNGSIGIIGDLESGRASLIVVRQGEKVFVYLNTCPHIGAPLDFTPGQFLNVERDLIQCAMHGALFTIEDGRCVQGPCMGKHLTPVTSELRKGVVWLVV